MKSFEQTVKEYYEPKPKADVNGMLQEMVEEALYYQGKDGIPRGPIGSTQKVASDIVKYIQRKYSDHYEGHSLELKKGKRVLQFMNFGDLTTRDNVIRDLVDKGWLEAPKVKRLGLYHRATTRFFDLLKNGKKVPIEIQLNSGAGAGRTGTQYETQMARFLNLKFQQMGRPYEAMGEGGTTNNPDITIWSPNFKSQNQFLSLEAKYTSSGVASLDFGQFQVQRVGGMFVQKTQLDSEEMVAIFNAIDEQINASCSLTYNPQSSGDLTNIAVEDLGERVERYYAEKGNEFIVYNDMLYSISVAGEERLPTALRFKDAVSGGFIRVRVKCHGKSYSTTAAAKFNSIKNSISITADQVIDILFPLKPYTK